MWPDRTYTRVQKSPEIRIIDHRQAFRSCLYSSVSWTTQSRPIHRDRGRISREGPMVCRLPAGGRRIRTAGPPRRNEWGFAAEREVPQRRKEPSRKRGTEGSNPGPSSGESIANPVDQEAALIGPVKRQIE